MEEKNKQVLSDKNELININYENTDRPTVMGRELHEALKIESNYTTWFKRMCEYGFDEGKDYATCFPNLESDNQQGYTKTKTHTHPGSDGYIHSSVHTYWTQKGRLFIYELLKSHGILPVIEREEEQEE